MNYFTVLLFGQIAEIISKSEIKVEVSQINNTQMLKNKLQLDFPELKNVSYSIAVNQQLINTTVSINTGDVVALLPPFAGG